jgi:hypothetical protein
MGIESVEHALNRRLSASHSVINAVSSLPDLLKLYANTYNKGATADTCVLEDLEEHPVEEEGSNDSAYPPSETISCDFSVSSTDTDSKSFQESNV